ncbi:phosphoribosylformylglycinamidine synthase subunit PurL [Gammaproteobacteria bacterium]|nr:phosphoribosylformylglycinamidine synthase subunit PurL [Gammaproteobacteria bacterium]
MLLSQEEVFDFVSISNDEIKSLLKKYNLALTPDEVLTIQKIILNRPPSLAELVLWSIQGSEHCSYKSSRKYLKTLVTDGPNVILGAKEDAGIVTVAVDNLGKRYGAVLSHESHNHPSQIVPYEGAATGVGGNVRDVCCMGSEVIAIADGLRFGDVNRIETQWIQDGVVSGIAGYGNPIGVPTIAGDVYYDSGYNDNCLVTVVTLGIIHEDDVIHSYAPENANNHLYILVGKPTDNSGFGGASFASTDLSKDNQEKSKGAVQEPNAFLKRHLLKANYALFNILKEKKLIDKVGFKDLGAGGVACASVEMAEASGYGAEINIENIPTSMENLHPSVILCSETQERFMWVVPVELADLILNHYNITFAFPDVSSGAKAAIVGKVTDTKKYIVKYLDKIIVDANASDITRGIVYDRPYFETDKKFIEPELEEVSDYNQVLLNCLSHENIASRSPIFEKYDKQVQGRSIIEAGEADAGVVQPFNDDKFPEEIRLTGVALSLDQCPSYNKISPYWGAVNAVVESVRNVAAVGAMPQAITDCLCFGNPEKPDQMWDFTESVRGIYDACKAIGLKDYKNASLPIIAGNVSFYNESKSGAIPPSPMIACVGNMSNVAFAITKDLKNISSELILVGKRLDECGGSIFYDLFKELGANLPKPDLKNIASEIHAVVAAIQSGKILSAHDISEGGVATALSEMTFKKEIGVKVNIPGDLNLAKKLFSQTGGFILEVSANKYEIVQKIFSDLNVPIINIGKTIKEKVIYINDVISLSIDSANKSYTNSLKEKL